MGRLDAAIAYANAQPRFFVYAITDETGQHVYVGATTHPERRYRQHLERSARYQLPLRRWVQANAHTFAVLSTHPSKRAMLDAERYAIKAHRPRFNAACE